MSKLSALLKLAEMIEGHEVQPGDCEPFKVGTAYLIRTVTHYAVGRLVYYENGFMVLSDASWVADTGRFHDALKSGDLNEVEPFIGKQIINTSAIIDATEWTHKLPAEQK